MRRSPLSTPGGSRIRNDYNWKSHDDMDHTNNSLNVDYERMYYPYNGGEMYRDNNQFIPLSNSTPNGKNQYNHNRNDSRNEFRRNCTSSGGRFSNDYKSCVFACRNSYLKSNNLRNHYQVLYKKMNKDGYKQINMSNYFDMKSVLEDPWAELQIQLDNSATSNNVNASDGCSSISNIKDSDNKSFCNTDFQNSSHNEQSQCQSIDAQFIGQ